MQLQSIRRFAAATLTIASLCTLTACDKVGSTINTSDFSKITSRDANGDFMGEMDVSDWTSNENWTTQEQKLFPKYGLYTQPDGQSILLSVYAYPNPTTEIINLMTFGMQPEGTTIEMRVVDKHYNLLAKTTVASLSATFDVSNLAKGHDEVRMYYMVVRGQDCVAKGHGDLRLK